MFNDIVKRILKTDSAQPVGRMFDQYVDPDPSFKMKHSENISKLFNQYTNPGPAFKFSEQPTIFNDKYSVKGSEMPQAPIEKPEDNTFTNFINPEILNLDYHESVMPTFIEYGGKRELGKSIFERGLDREDFNMNATEDEISKLGVAREQFMRKFQLENNIDLKGKNIKRHGVRLSEINEARFESDKKDFDDRLKASSNAHEEKFKDLIDVEPVDEDAATRRRERKRSTRSAQKLNDQPDFDEENIRKAHDRAVQIKQKDTEEKFLMQEFSKKRQGINNRYRKEKEDIEILTEGAIKQTAKNNRRKAYHLLENMAKKHFKRDDYKKNVFSTFKKNVPVKKDAPVSTSLKVPEPQQEPVHPDFEGTPINNESVPTLPNITRLLNIIDQEPVNNYKKQSELLNLLIDELDAAVNNEKAKRGGKNNQIISELKERRTMTSNYLRKHIIPHLNLPTEEARPEPPKKSSTKSDRVLRSTKSTTPADLQQEQDQERFKSILRHIENNENRLRQAEEADERTEYLLHIVEDSLEFYKEYEDSGFELNWSMINEKEKLERMKKKYEAAVRILPKKRGMEKFKKAYKESRLNKIKESRASKTITNLMRKNLEAKQKDTIQYQGQQYIKSPTKALRDEVYTGSPKTQSQKTPTTNTGEFEQPRRPTKESRSLSEKTPSEEVKPIRKRSGKVSTPEQIALEAHKLKLLNQSLENRKKLNEIVSQRNSVKQELKSAKASGKQPAPTALDAVPTYLDEKTAKSYDEGIKFVLKQNPEGSGTKASKEDKKFYNEVARMCNAPEIASNANNLTQKTLNKKIREELLPLFNYKWTLDRLQGGRPRDVASGAAVVGGGGVVLDPEEEVRLPIPIPIAIQNKKTKAGKAPPGLFG
jgi:hypothetical protein